MSALKKLLLAGWLVAALPAPALAADNGVVGMVLDLQGPVQLIDSAGPARLQLLTHLLPGMRLELPAGARASVTVYASRSVYRLQGPATAEITGDGLKMLRGQPPEIRSMGERAVAAAQTGNLIPGAYRMRSLAVAPKVVLTAPENGSVLLQTRPSFDWEAAEPATYTITLKAESGGLSYTSTVGARGWSLPDGVQLEYGKSYDWKVSYPSPSGDAIHSASGKFSLATQAEIAELAALRPAATDPVEDWVFYAVVLQQRHVRAEARSAWQRVALQRPEQARAVELAR